MNFCQVNWEDEDKNREVLFRVEYTAAGQNVAISNITPEKVTFLCAETQKPLRSIRIWTNKARTMLVKQYRESSQFSNLEQELASQPSVATV